MASVNIPMTRRKLDEAKFFLGYMEGETRRTPSRNPRDRDVFGHFLSAFIGAARSVTWVFKAEDKGLYERTRPGWESTFTLEDRALLDFMNERRLDEVKRTGAELEHETRVIPITDLPREGAAHLIMLQILWPSAGGPVSTVGVPAPRFPNVGGESLEVVPTCRRYVELLEALVSAGERSDP